MRTLQTLALIGLLVPYSVSAKDYLNPKDGGSLSGVTIGVGGGALKINSNDGSASGDHQMINGSLGLVTGSTYHGQLEGDKVLGFLFTNEGRSAVELGGYLETPKSGFQVNGLLRDTVAASFTLGRREIGLVIGGASNVELNFQNNLYNRPKTQFFDGSWNIGAELGLASSFGAKDRSSTIKTVGYAAFQVGNTPFDDFMGGGRYGGRLSANIAKLAHLNADCSYADLSGTVTGLVHETEKRCSGGVELRLSDRVGMGFSAVVADDRREAPALPGFLSSTTDRMLVRGDGHLTILLGKPSASQQRAQIGE
ncbi:MAG: hypothetical protein ACXWPM_10535 [Bdellovibrionota bacterium]